MYVIYLHPISSFKGSTPRSDTLFGALCWAMRTLYGEEKTLKPLLERFHPTQEGIGPDPPFLLSSTFPFLKAADKKVHLLPKPKGAFQLKRPTTLAEIRRLKDFKKVRYVTEGLFSRLINGKLDEVTLYGSFLSDGERGKGTDLERYQTVQFGSLLVERELAGQVNGNWCSILDIPHNAINRLSGTVDEGKLFSSEELFVAEGSGLYFLMQFLDESWKDKVSACWRFLGDRGIGGDVSVGKGQFTVYVEERVLFSEPKTASRFTTLSLFFSEENLDGQEVWYEWVKRKGKLESAYVPTTDIWKRTVLMYGEGSVFPWDGRVFYGYNPIVKEVDDLRVQQYGFAFPVRMV